MLFHILGHFCERSAGKENFVDAFVLHLPGVVVRDRAPTPTENRDVVCPLLLQLANDIGKKIDVTAVVTGNSDRSHVFWNCGTPDITDIPMKSQVNDSDSVPDELEINGVNGALWPVTTRDRRKTSNRLTHLPICS